MKQSVVKNKRLIDENKRLINQVKILKEQIKRHDNEKNNIYQIVQREVSLDYDLVIDELNNKIKSLT